MAHELNPSQRMAVETLTGPLLVLAGAGSGKTRVVTYRIANLIRGGIRPSRIVAVTFTNKAAAEMQQRSAALLGKRPAERPEISTFHSLCLRILRRHHAPLGLPARFAICDRGDQESLARAALREIRVDSESLRPGDLISQISAWKTQSLRPEEAAAAATTDRQHLASMAYRRYQKALRAAGSVDFDDLLLCTEELFEKFPDIRRQEAARADHLLVDEYQDTNGSQYRIVRALASGHRNLCVVGDDDQSIYGWRGAEVTHILRFKVDWPDARIVRLEENYRSTSAILEVANRLIAFNSERHDKVLRAARIGGEKPRIIQAQDEEDEARQVVRDIAARLAAGVEPRDFAILYRTNEQPRPFEIELRAAKIPYVLVGGQSFYDRKEVRDILAYLKVLTSPSDEVSLLRVVNNPPRGIGQKAVEGLLGKAVASGVPLWQVLSGSEARGLVSPAAAESLKRFVALIDEFSKRAARDALPELISHLITRIGYQDELARLYKEPAEQQTRWSAVEEVVNASAAYSKRDPNPTLAGFLDETVLGDREFDDDKEHQLRRNGVALMTLHAAKGLEFPNVYLIGLEEGILPHHRSVAAGDRSIDEERRLCYVGVTRAQERLTISLPLVRMKWGKSRPTLPSRFLFEITGAAERARNVAMESQKALQNSQRGRRKTSK